MTIDKRSTIGKMIDSSKVVYRCLRCGRDHIGDSNTNLHYCPRCKETQGVTLVMVDNLVIRK